METKQDFLDKMLFNSIKILIDNKERESLSPIYSESLAIVSTNLDRLKELIETAKMFEYWKGVIRRECNKSEGQEFSRLVGINQESLLWLENKKEFEENKKTIKAIKDLCKKPYAETLIFEVYNKIQEMLKK